MEAPSSSCIGCAASAGGSIASTVLPKFRHVAPRSLYEAIRLLSDSGPDGAPTPAHDAADTLIGRPPMLHKAFPGTAGACTGVAAFIAGTVVAEATGTRDGDQVVIGHPSGVMVTRARMRDGPPWTAERAGYSRTARRLMEGYAFLRPSVRRAETDRVPRISAAGRR